MPVFANVVTLRSDNNISILATHFTSSIKPNYFWTFISALSLQIGVSITFSSTSCASSFLTKGSILGTSGSKLCVQVGCSRDLCDWKILEPSWSSRILTKNGRKTVENVFRNSLQWLDVLRAIELGDFSSIFPLCCLFVLPRELWYLDKNYYWKIFI